MEVNQSGLKNLSPEEYISYLNWNHNANQKWKNDLYCQKEEWDAPRNKKRRRKSEISFSCFKKNVFKPFESVKKTILAQEVENDENKHVLEA